ncbi:MULTISPECIES: hypothetical protein [Streptomyces]|uniref:hypothetical protein n=1 Tax=Streptomyces TaxID=1883 RepID=UPI0036126940
MSFYGLPDDRRVWLGWMSNWDYPFSAPTGGWSGIHRRSGWPPGASPDPPGGRCCPACEP